MANHISHASLPYIVKGARFTVLVPYLDADGDPTDPTTPDTEFSLDGGSFTDTAEEVTTITGGRGMGYITLTGAETNGSALGIWAGVASGPKATVMTPPIRVLPTLETGTAQAGGAALIQLAVGAASYDLTGCIVKTTGGTGGGGTGGANNQARVITAYNTATKEAIVEPNWEINPAPGTTYAILLTEHAMTLIGLTTSALAQIKNQAVAALDFDAYAEPGQETPAATATLAQKIGYLYKFLRNRVRVTDTTIEVYNDNATTVDHKSTHSNSGTIYDRGEFTTGP